jgi:hypothetical protein
MSSIFRKPSDTYYRKTKFTVLGGDYGVGTVVHIDDIIDIGTVVRAHVHPEGRRKMRGEIWLLIIAGFFNGRTVGRCSIGPYLRISGKK